MPPHATFPVPQSPVMQEKFPVVRSVEQRVRPQNRPFQSDGTVTVEESPEFKTKPVVDWVWFPPLVVVVAAGHTV